MWQRQQCGVLDLFLHNGLIIGTQARQVQGKDFRGYATRRETR